MMTSPRRRGTAPVPERQQQSGHFLGPPTSRTGRWALGCVGAALLCFAVANVGIAFGQRGGDTFFDNPFLSFTMLAAAACALAGGGLAAFALATRRDRSGLLLLPLLLGLVVAFFVVGEVVWPH